MASSHCFVGAWLACAAMMPATRTDVSIATSTSEPSQVSWVLFAVNSVIQLDLFYRSREDVKPILQHEPRAARWFQRGSLQRFASQLFA